MVTDSTFTCAVTEPSTGAASGVDVTTTAYVQVDGGAHQPYTLGQTFTVELGHATEVVVANALALAPPTPTPTPTPVPSPPTEPSGLADTGSTGPQPWILPAAALLVAAGVAAVAGARMRRSRGR